MLNALFSIARVLGLAGSAPEFDREHLEHGGEYDKLQGMGAYRAD